MLGLLVGQDGTGLSIILPHVFVASSSTMDIFIWYPILASRFRVQISKSKHPITISVLWVGARPVARAADAGTGNVSRFRDLPRGKHSPVGKWRGNVNDRR
jgi:hypothetical protein